LTGGSCSRTTEILDGNAGALPSRKPFTIRQSPVAIRRSFWLGNGFALPFRPLTEVGGYEKRSVLKQANKVASCGLCVRRKNLTPNPQPATLNSQPDWQALACFDFVATYLGWVVKAVCHSPLATHYSPPFSSLGQEPDPPNYSLMSTLFKPVDLTIAFAICLSDSLNLRDSALSLHALQSGT